MDATTLLITVSCLIDDWLAGRRLRQRGPQPTLADSEVLTIECVGEFLGIDTDKGLDEHFCRHWGDWFSPWSACTAPASCGRRRSCRRLAGLAAFGRDEGAKQTFSGVRAHLRVCWPGVIADTGLAPANLHDLVMAEELLEGVAGWGGCPGFRRS